MPIHFEWTHSIFKQKYSKSSNFDTFLKQRFICRFVGTMLYSTHYSFSPLLLQLYKATVHNTVIEFIPLTMNAITLQPSAAARQAPSFNKEVYVDFVAVQIKFLSFLAYIIRIYQV